MKAKLVVMLAALVLAACGGGNANDDSNDSSTETVTTMPSTSTTASSTPDQGEPMDGVSPAESDIVAAAIADLAERLGVQADAITLVEFERVTWRDGSLGCPEPGMLYTQALVEGSRTLLSVDDATYAYHAGEDDRPFLCENPVLDPGRGALPTPPSGES
jgi:hypothetical protein